MRQEPLSLDRGARESVTALSGLGMVASRVLACVGALVGVAVWCSLTASSSAFAASPVVVTFSYSSNAQYFTAPPGVTSLNLTVQGGGGGSGFSGGSTGGAGGGGTKITGTWQVTPESTLLIDTGPAGGNGTAPDGWCGINLAADISQGGAGGLWAGDGGLGDLCGGGGGGGGGCDSAVTVTYPDDSARLLIDAGGGGGGGGGGGIAGYGGGAGGSGGQANGNGSDGSGPGHGSGGAGSQSDSADIMDGGYAATSSSAGGGGGGGCGWDTGLGGNGGTGGGAGAGGGGGGGAGNSFVDGSITNAVTSSGPSGANGAVVISYTLPASMVQISRIRPNPPGPSVARAAALRNTASNRMLNGEWIRLRNVGRKARQLRGWLISDADGHGYRFGRLKLRSGASVTVHSGRGRDTAKHRYWGRRDEVWDNNRDFAHLRRPNGTFADMCRYDASRVRC